MGEVKEASSISSTFTPSGAVTKVELGAPDDALPPAASTLASVSFRLLTRNAT